MAAKPSRATRRKALHVARTAARKASRARQSSDAPVVDARKAPTSHAA